MAHRVEDPPVWLTAKDAAALLGISRFSFVKMAETGCVGRRMLPGCRVAYNKADVLRVGRDAVKKPSYRPRGAKASAVAT